MKKLQDKPWFGIQDLWLKLALGLGFVAVTWLVLSHAWFSDDAYFSFRSIDNFVNGYGLTWNVQERVQGYTHPLWVLLLSAFYFFTREIYLTTIFVSLALALGSAWLIIYKLAAIRWQGVAAVGLLCLSTAFIDYSTSGLENPLSHLLFGIFLFLYLRGQETGKGLLWLALVAALAAVNRLDTLLLYLPALLYAWWQQGDKRRATLQVALGFAPLLAWEIFSVIYYGFPFPNTFYAKAQNYVPLAQELWAGINYFLFTLFFDPITWVIILAALSVVVWQRQAKGISVTIGILLYLIYVLLIGGDFMGGRFLSLGYFGAAILLLVYLIPQFSLRKNWALLPALLLVSLMGSSPPYFLYAKGFETARWNGVVDERMVYYTTNFVRIEDFYAFNADPDHNLLNQAAYLARSLWRGTAFRLEADHDWIDEGRQLRARAEREGKLYLPQGANGFTGYYAGPEVYILHGLALTDGLLARVPPIYNPNWRSGHFMRLIPAGYLELEAGQQAHLDDAALDAYYQQIRLLTQGELFSAERWAAIWELNTRDFADLVPGQITHFRFPGLQTVRLETIALNAEVGLNLAFAGQGSAAQIEFPQLMHSSMLELTLSAGDNFLLVYLDENGEELGSQILLSAQAEGNKIHQVAVPQPIAASGFAAMRIVPIRYYYTEADGSYMLANLWFDQ
jgi:arabinofuranosyltransferase